MKIALVTTTITPPTILAAYRALDASVTIIVAGDAVDDATERAIVACCESVNARYLSYDEQADTGYRIHSLIGPRSLQRRNFATLAALKDGADVIVSIDTDNAPVGDFFGEIQRGFDTTNVRASVISRSEWWDPGALAIPPFVTRGLPVEARTTGTRGFAGQVAALQGMVSGDPDTSALERLASAPTPIVVEGFAECLRHGLVLDPRTTWSVLNTQATAWRHYYAPVIGLSPGIGRFDDIVSGWLVQRIAMEYGAMISYGPPFVHQERFAHDLLDDLEAELWGMRWGQRFCDDLKSVKLASCLSIHDMMKEIAAAMRDWDYLPSIVPEFYTAWLAALERVL